MSTGLMITLAGLAVAGFSSLLGMWLERDASKPKKIAFALSFLILLATGVGMVQAMLDAEEQDKMQEDMARMLATLDKIASSSDVAIPELDNLVKSELSAQSRSNPDIVKKMAQRVADEGGDPNAVLGSYLPASEVQEIGRKGGLKVKPPAVAVMSVGKPAEKPRDRERPTLADVASGKASLPGAAPKPVEPPPEASAPPTVAAAPPTAAPAPPPMVAAVRKAPAAMPAKLPAPVMKTALPTSPKAAVAAFKPAAAAADPGAAAAAAKAKAAADAQAKADAAKAAAEGAKAKAAADAKAKADEAKKKAEAAKKKAVEDAKKKIPGGFGF